MRRRAGGYPSGERAGAACSVWRPLPTGEPSSHPLESGFRAAGRRPASHRDTLDRPRPPARARHQIEMRPRRSLRCFEVQVPVRLAVVTNRLPAVRPPGLVLFVAARAAERERVGGMHLVSRRAVGPSFHCGSSVARPRRVSERGRAVPEASLPVVRRRPSSRNSSSERHGRSSRGRGRSNVKIEGARRSAGN